MDVPTTGGRLVRAGRWTTGSVAIALALSACGTVERDAPPELVAGRDACLECGMIINELRFAAGYVDSEGISHGFDDLGCLARHDETRVAEPAPTMWVMDFNLRRWRRSSDVWFVRCDSVLTPMGYGIVALGDSLEAARLAAVGTRAFRYDALRRLVVERQRGAAPAGATTKE